MLKKAIIFTMLLAVAAMFSGLVIADDGAKKEVKHEFVGAKKCKMCHTKDGIYPSWEETKHAHAWELLNEEQQKDPECVKCHSTGTTAEGELLTGIQCEACHGAGADYKKKSIMEDRDAAIANGLVIPTADVCIVCHENVPEQFRAKEKFDFEKMKTKGVHTMPVKEEATKKTEG